jgi:crotonobetainyl-CoA:carnitine CoA-transferase CaiB-like acyl-CoA transferase
MYATQAILAALLRGAYGDDDGDGDGAGGQKVDVSLFDGQLAWMSYMASSYFVTGDPPKRMGSRHPTIAPYQAFPTRDGYVVVAGASEKTWRNLCRALDRPDLIDDERFERNADRVANREELEAILEREIEPYTTSEAVDLFEEGDVPASDVNDIADAFSHPQAEARGMRTSVEHPAVGTIEMAGIPMHFSESAPGVRRHPPELGEHTSEILAELGYDPGEVNRLEEDGVV